MGWVCVVRLLEAMIDAGTRFHFIEESLGQPCHKSYWDSVRALDQRAAAGNKSIFEQNISWAGVASSAG